jgi:hypothetical protein
MNHLATAIVEPQPRPFPPGPPGCIEREDSVQKIEFKNYLVEPTGPPIPPGPPGC